MMKIAIPNDVEIKLRANAEAANLAADEYIVQFLREKLIVPSSELSATESELLQIINEGLPDETWARFHRLNEKRQDETLTNAEQQELIALSDRLEAINVQRMGALVRLSEMRQVSLDELMASLGIAPPNYG